MKRFTETNKWQDPWFRRLSLPAKLLWLYLTDNCDPIGLIDLDLEDASFRIGTNIEEKHLTELGDRTQRTPNGKLFIGRFITFQYGTPSPDCLAHKTIIRLIHEHNLSPSPKGYQYPTGRLPVGNQKGSNTLQEKNKEKNKDRGGTGGDFDFGIFPSGFEQEWRYFIEHRNAKRAKMTPHAQDLILKTLAERPGDATEALKTAIKRCWTGFEWSWIDNDRGRRGFAEEKPLGKSKNDLLMEETMRKREHGQSD